MTPKDLEVLPAKWQDPSQFPAAPEGFRWTVIDGEQAEASSLPISHYLWVLRRHSWHLAGFVAAVVLATVLVSLRITPVYEGVTTVYIDRQEARDLVGQTAQVNQNIAAEDEDSFMASQIKLIQSDSVVRPIAEKYRLLDREKQIKRQGDRAKAEAAPIVLKDLKVSRPNTTFILQIAYRSTDPVLAANVANEIAESYITHLYTIRIRSSQNLSKFMEREIEELRARMEASSAREAQIERELNVVNPEERTNILSQRLTQLNTELIRAQAERVRAESMYNVTRSGELEAAEATAQGDALKKLLESRDEVENRFAEAREHFGVNHPEYRKLEAQLNTLRHEIDDTRRNAIRRVEIEYRAAKNQEDTLSAAVAAAKQEIDSLAGRYIEFQRAHREADADKLLYDELIKKIREAGINAGFQNNVVRVADPARAPWKPVFPKLWLNVLLAFLFSVLLGVGAAILNDALDTSIRDPEHIRGVLRTQVVGSLPSVRDTASLMRPLRLATAQDAGTLQLMPNGEPQLTSYDEAVRTLRSSILLADVEHRIRTLLLTSASPGEGKSTTAAHIAHLHAQQKHKTLLIDCDLRRPSQHRMFHLTSPAGLSSVLDGRLSWRDAIIEAPDTPHLHIICAGPPSRRAADLIGPAIQDLLDDIGSQYDMIVLDGPPLLGFAESLEMARAVDGVVVIARAGETPRRAVQSALQTLSRLRANVIGLALNEVKRHHGDQYYYYGYGKYYQHYRADRKPSRDTRAAS